MVNPPMRRNAIPTNARKMGKLFLTALGLLIIVVAVGVAYFAISDPSPPAGKVEHAIPDSRLPQ
jgi:hypothetical protein